MREPLFYTDPENPDNLELIQKIHTLTPRSRKSLQDFLDVLYSRDQENRKNALRVVGGNHAAN